MLPWAERKSPALHVQKDPAGQLTLTYRTFAMCQAADELLIHITVNPNKTLSSGVIIPLRQEEQKVEESSLITSRQQF